jgi:hypothetical protein
MLGDVGFWARNGIMLQTLGTLGILGVTAVYAALTWRIASATNRQAQATEMAVRHGRNVLVESVKARLSAMTPVCTVLFYGSSMTHVDGTSIGNVPMEMFDEILVKVSLWFVVRNDGDSPSLLTASPVAISDEELTSAPNWAPPAREEVLPPPGERGFELRCGFSGAGRMFRRWGDEGRRVVVEIETKSPISGVIDRHSWVGVFQPIQMISDGDSAVYNQSANLGFSGSNAAYPTRVWPPGLELE